MKAVAENKKIEEEQAADQVILNYGKQIGLVTPEIEANYIKGGHAQKTGIVGGLLRQFTMSQQQKEADALERHRQAQEQNAAAHLALAQRGTQTIPYKVGDQTYNIPESEAARLAVSQTKQPGDEDTIDDVGPDGKTYHVSIRSAYGQKLLEQRDPRKALMWQYGKEPDEMYDDNQIAAGVQNPQTGAFTKTKPEVATHIQVGGDAVMPKEKFYYFKRRLDKAGLNPNAQPDTGKSVPAPAPEKGSGGPVKVKTIEEAQKLPKGTPFIDPNGVPRIR